MFVKAFSRAAVNSSLCSQTQGSSCVSSGMHIYQHCIYTPVFKTNIESGQLAEIANVLSGGYKGCHVPRDLGEEPPWRVFLIPRLTFSAKFSVQGDLLKYVSLTIL